MANISPRRHTNGTVSWRVQYRINGKGRQETFLTEQDAQRFQDLVHRLGGEQARETLTRRRQPATLDAETEAKMRYPDIDVTALNGEPITYPNPLATAFLAGVQYERETRETPGYASVNADDYT